MLVRRIVFYCFEIYLYKNYLEFKGFFSLRTEIILSAVVTVIIYGFQLYLGMRNYKKHRLQLYKGIYEDVPSAANFKPNAIASKSVHYSGFLVGYMAWGFVICFHLIFFTLSAVRIVSLQLRYVEFILAITVPVLVVYLLKMVSTSSAGKFLFIRDMDEKLNLKNRKTYAIFVYFNFFAGKIYSIRTYLKKPNFFYFQRLFSRYCFMYYSFNKSHVS
jgi:hypothetical protein